MYFSNAVANLLANSVARLLAEGEAAIVSYDDLSSIMTSITTQWSVTNIVAVISGVIAAAIGFTFLWWGARYLVDRVITAIKTGRFSL